MHSKVKVILSLLASFLFVIPVYIVLHEGGHTMIAVLCGAKITKFSVLGAYMSYEGGSFTSTTLSLLDAAGMLLPVLIAVVYMLTYRNNVDNIPYRIFSFMFTLVLTCPVLAWVMMPILYLAGQVPQNDDITQFISHSGLNPLVVSFAAVILFTCCFFIAWEKKIIQIYWATVSQKAYAGKRNTDEFRRNQ